MAKQWPDWMNMALGLWLTVAPFSMQHSATDSAGWNAYVIGLLIAIISIGTVGSFQIWKEWANLTLGFWLIISPWILGFSSNLAATWNHAIVGLLVVVFSTWQIPMTREHEPRSV